MIGVACTHFYVHVLLFVHYLEMISSHHCLDQEEEWTISKIINFLLTMIIIKPPTCLMKLICKENNVSCTATCATGFVCFREM